jgi:hypothetical protein
MQGQYVLNDQDAGYEASQSQIQSRTQQGSDAAG